MLTLLAPAKLNLTLEVLAKRPDGFHEIHSVIQAINLCDSLRFRLSKNVEFVCNDPSWDPARSLVSRATNLLRKTTGCSKGVQIEVDKHIPLVSGLSGDSSDAAAVLRGLNKLWGLGLSLPQLLELASQLGSDVAFFLYGGTAVIRGRGEIVTPLPPFPHMRVVIMLPPVLRLPGKTQRLYTSLKPSCYTDGRITDRFAVLLMGGREIALSMLFNVLDKVAVDSFTGLGEYWQQFLRAGAQEVRMAGSGPALFTLVKAKAQAEKIYHNLQQQGLETYLTETLATI